MAALFAVLMAKCYFIPFDFAARRLSLSEPDFFTLNVDFAGSWRAASAAEGDLLALNLTLANLGRWWWARPGLLTVPNRDVGLVSLDLSWTTALALAHTTANADVLALHLSHAGRRRWRASTAANDKGVLLDLTTAHGGSRRDD
jgi:hypothetical protein